ncbi:MAG: hypothetical protein WCH96_12050 [Betaproteobacteria bacterium]
MQSATPLRPQPTEATKVYVIDSANAAWKRSSSEGIHFECQVLLSGEDGGPEAMRFRFDDCPSVYAHMHLTAQFQLLLSGAMDFPRGIKHLQAPGLHYTDHNMPYGPFAVSGGHDMLVLHPKAGGIISMAQSYARREINLQGRLLATEETPTEWENLPGVPGAQFKHLIPYGHGPTGVLVKVSARAELKMPAPTFGRYEVVVSGSALIEGKPITAPGFRYSIGPEPASPIISLEEGTQIAFLSFDQEALAGGLEHPVLGIEAAAAMARSI